MHVHALNASAGPLTWTWLCNGVHWNRTRDYQLRAKSSPWWIPGSLGSHHRSQDFLHKFPFRDRKYITLLRGENTLSSAWQKQADQHFLKLSICLFNTHFVHAAPMTLLWSYKPILPHDLLHMVYNAMSRRINLWHPQHNSEVSKEAYFN